MVDRVILPPQFIFFQKSVVFFWEMYNLFSSCKISVLKLLLFTKKDETKKTLLSNIYTFFSSLENFFFLPYSWIFRIVIPSVLDMWAEHNVVKAISN